MRDNTDPTKVGEAIIAIAERYKMSYREAADLVTTGAVRLPESGPTSTDPTTNGSAPKA